MYRKEILEKDKNVNRVIFLRPYQVFVLWHYMGIQMIQVVLKCWVLYSVNIIKCQNNYIHNLVKSHPTFLKPCIFIYSSLQHYLSKYVV